MMTLPECRVIGEYIVTQKLGEGSFAVVWRGCNRSTGTEVAIKEISTEKFGTHHLKCLQWEIAILKGVNHPNIIRLLDIVEEPNRIFLVLEYCTGGDLDGYIRRNGRVSEAAARNFMRQMGAGLEVLRANNVIHRDLKPQNLLLSTKDGNTILKIADFGFARPLQPKGMAATLCGSPLYMAPEILQRRSYNAKADLWSVGAILFQLLTGHPPYTGNNNELLLANIMNSGQVKFPEYVLAKLHPDCVDLIRKLLRPNPVERLSFEEFFNHSFLGPMGHQANRRSPGQVINHPADLGDSNVDSFSLSLDDQSHGLAEVHLRMSVKPELLSSSPTKSQLETHGGVTGKFSVGIALATRGVESRRSQLESSSLLEEKSVGQELAYCPVGQENKLQKSSSSKQAGAAGVDSNKQSRDTFDPSSPITSSKGGGLADSTEYLEGEYVLVGNIIPTESEGKMLQLQQKNLPSGIRVSSPQTSGSQARTVLLGHGSPAQKLSDVEYSLEGPSSDPPTRLSSLKRCARLISELASEKVNDGKVLDSLAVQLVCLAIWKESLHVCQTWAAAAAEGNEQNYSGACESYLETDAASACSLMEREFGAAVDRAEDLATHARALDGWTEMQDGMESIYQRALEVGRIGAVEELMGRLSNAAVAYAKAAALFYFLMVEAPHLPLNPPLELTSVDKGRLLHYANSVTQRQNQCLSQAEMQEQQGCGD